MKRVTTLSIVICVQALLLFFWIYKENHFIHLKRDLQSKKHTLKNIEHDIQELLYKIHTIKNPHTVDDFAQKHNLEPIKTGEMISYDS